MFKRKAQIKLKLSTTAIQSAKLGPESPAPPLTAAPFIEETYPNGPLLIDTGIYLGSQSSAQNLNQMSKLGISCVVSVAKELCSPRTPQCAGSTTIIGLGQNQLNSYPNNTTGDNTVHIPSIQSLSLKEDQIPLSKPIVSPQHQDSRLLTARTRGTRSDSAVSFSSPLSESSHVFSPSCSHCIEPNSFDSFKGTVANRQTSVFDFTPSESGLLTPSSSTKDASSPCSSCGSVTDPMRRFDCICSGQNICRHAFPWTHGEDITRSIDTALNTILDARAAGKSVLVHCQQGVSRSAALVIAYIMKTKQMSFKDAYAHVKMQSPIISPNMTLISQLVELEARWQLRKPSITESDQESVFVPSCSRGEPLLA